MRREENTRYHNEARSRRQGAVPALYSEIHEQPASTAAAWKASSANQVTVEAPASASGLPGSQRAVVARAVPPGAVCCWLKPDRDLGAGTVPAGRYRKVTRCSWNPVRHNISSLRPVGPPTGCRGTPRAGLPPGGDQVPFALNG